ncbi:MAG: hypothetical protein K2K44_07460 [Oscillospiraceae bacterium]|nr:hypothetical protein [Oscillospiraceae bacterium]
MLEIEERLFDEYKRVDNICRDIFSSQNGINQYITEMNQKSFYERSLVSSWDKDYRMLKHVQWLRNQIAHESSATDCNEEDAAWLENFHRRLLEQQDPLALIRKAERERSNYSPRQEMKSNPYYDQWMYRNVDLQEKKDSSDRTVVALIVLVILIIFTAAALFLVFR